MDVGHGFRARGARPPTHTPYVLSGLVRLPNESRMSRARQWYERCGEARAARVTQSRSDAALPSVPLFGVRCGAAERASA